MKFNELKPGMILGHKRHIVVEPSFWIIKEIKSDFLEYIVLRYLMSDHRWEVFVNAYIPKERWDSAEYAYSQLIKKNDSEDFQWIAKKFFRDLFDGKITI